MARVLNIDETTFYRALVTRQRPDGTTTLSVYGPYSLPGQARDYDDRWYRQVYGVTGTKTEVQRLEPVITDLPDDIIVNLGWVTTKTRTSPGWTA
ncbi:hypothetical protein OHA79_09470 [Streptomyces sp. NBC_00841]|uniref:hypothetical protein n=1 Tax=Streptomyces sp. NBC_00841 TaxID=2975847 RepID=UPI002DD953BB|nr:hypothetical protein [Streptomyces sp. NBC_00841]WRZ98043.1 hypothetical protein OHA79_09470 [Streptomyces sp. NBC_00841]